MDKWKNMNDDKTRWVKAIRRGERVITNWMCKNGYYMVTTTPLVRAILVAMRNGDLDLLEEVIERNQPSKKKRKS